jgi:hypothetical protein
VQANRNRQKVGSHQLSATKPVATIGSVLYQRIPKLFADLALARGDGRYAFLEQRAIEPARGASRGCWDGGSARIRVSPLEQPKEQDLSRPAEPTIPG